MKKTLGFIGAACLIFAGGLAGAGSFMSTTGAKLASYDGSSALLSAGFFLVAGIVVLVISRVKEAKGFGVEIEFDESAEKSQSTPVAPDVNAGANLSVVAHPVATPEIPGAKPGDDVSGQAPPPSPGPPTQPEVKK